MGQCSLVNTVLGTNCSGDAPLCETRALYLLVLFEGTWYLEDIWMEQCNRLELELGEIVKCMGGTGCEGVCLNMHSIVYMHLCVGAMDNFPFEDQQLIPCIFFIVMLMLIEFRMLAAEV